MKKKKIRINVKIDKENIITITGQIDNMTSVNRMLSDAKKAIEKELKE